MNKVIALFLVLSLMLCGCSELIPPKSTLPPETVPVLRSLAAEPETIPETVPETEPETQPETEPEPVYVNPLNGSVMDGPMEQRIFAISINNLREAVPHYGINKADLFFESFVNGSIIRCLALYTDPSAADVIGPVRSTRVMWADLCMRFNAINAHAGGTNFKVSNPGRWKWDNFNIDVQDDAYYAFRDMDRYKNQKYAWEHCLFIKGPGLIDKAEEKGVSVYQDPEKDFCLQFTEDGTPENGQDALDFTVTITMRNNRKDSRMVYDSQLGKYVFHQYDQQMVDGATGEPEAFRNVVILMGEMRYDGIYEVMDFEKGGTGWFACGGRAIPITWYCDDTASPPRLFTEDGQSVALGQGNTYIAITENGSKLVGLGDGTEA